MIAKREVKEIVQCTGCSAEWSVGGFNGGKSCMVNSQIAERELVKVISLGMNEPKTAEI